MKRKSHPNDSSIVRSSYASFEELRKHLEEAPSERITISMDKHLLEGGTLVELQKKAAKDNKRLGSNDYRTRARVKTHINSRRNHWHWVIEENAIGEFRIVGYGRDVDEGLRSAHMRRGQEFTSK